MPIPSTDRALARRRRSRFVSRSWFPGSKIDVYLGIDNALDKNPPLNYFSSDSNSGLYDNIGQLLRDDNYQFLSLLRCATQQGPVNRSLAVSNISNET
ncbi:hypothetical protein [Xanthomonas fragariae]|uniref:hypothetical protein n=1 Tax=Xanthomonas fragariae TaxID=48664 RepID=UPI0022AA54E3|nr:hypothetical protein [Xanthomonas fragariae]WAT15810.1 hypothetical protein OZ429_05430 [Xanthomonas fragariae]